jgi:hypothetical protein
MPVIDDQPAAIKPSKVSKFLKLRILLYFSVVDSLSAWLLVLLYTTGLDLVWLVNLNLATMSILLVVFSINKFRLTAVSGFLGICVIMSLCKLVFFLEGARGFEWIHFVTYFQGLFLPIAALSFASKFNRDDLSVVQECLVRYAKVFMWVSFPGILVYSALYFLGYISYFGLGSNLYYVYPFVATRGVVVFTLIFFAIALITGKRATLVVLFFQFLLLQFKLIRSSKVSAVFLVGTFVLVVIWIYGNTDLFFRFRLIFETEFDFSDPYFLSISGGGRFEEVFGIYDYFKKYPFDLLFGSPPGSYYSWEIEWSEYTATKNYSHITWFGYIFRYGLFFALPLLGYFVYSIFRNLGSASPFFISFGGIFVVSFFGAVLVIDPMAWILIGMFFYLGRPSKMLTHAIGR